MTKKLKIEKKITKVEVDINIINLENGIIRLDGMPFIFVENSVVKVYKKQDNSCSKGTTDPKNTSNSIILMERKLGTTMEGNNRDSIDLGESHIGNPF